MIKYEPKALKSTAVFRAKGGEKNPEGFHLVWLYIQFFLELTWIFLYSLYYAFKFVVTRFYPPEPKSLRGETILVTGGANGIGRQLCLQLAKHENVAIVSWDYDQEENEKLVKELKGRGVAKAFGYQVDVSNRLQVEETAEKMRQEVGDVTILFNNAGICGEVGNAWEMSPENIQKVFEINTISHCWTLASFLPAMIKKGRGHVIQTCSIFGVVHGATCSAYMGSKHAVKAYTESVKEDVRHLPSKPDIKFSLVYPSHVVTKMTTPLNPRPGKYPFLANKMSPEFVAATVIEGMRQNEEHIFVPKNSRIVSMIWGLMPPPVIRKLTDLIDPKMD